VLAFETLVAIVACLTASQRPCCAVTSKMYMGPAHTSPSSRRSRP
jgi:hypothetical protein